MTDLQYDIVTDFRDRADFQNIKDKYKVTLSEMHEALRVALRESWIPSRRQRPKPQHPSEVGTTKL